MKGVVKWYDKEKGYGFISGEDEKDYFVHHTHLPENQETIKDEEQLKVEFEVIETQRGTQAQKVVFVDNSAEE